MFSTVKIYKLYKKMTIDILCVVYVFAHKEETVDILCDNNSQISSNGKHTVMKRRYI